MAILPGGKIFYEKLDTKPEVDLIGINLATYRLDESICPAREATYA
jgi:hypothetical protein